MTVKPGKLYANDDGDILTVRERDEADRIVVDVEGDFKTFADDQEFQEFVEKNEFHETDHSVDLEKLNDEEDDMEDDDFDMDDMEDDEEIDDLDDEEEDDIEEPSPENKVQKFKDLYTKMIDMGSTGNDKIDSAVNKLKKALSDELNQMTSEGVEIEDIYNDLKKDGYIK